MGERNIRRGAGAPFYAPPRRKTSAEIISEARAAIYGDTNGSSSGSGGALRPIRTRRPFTPREPQRALFTEKTCKRDTRPPSAFDLKHLSLSETSEDVLVTSGARISGLEEDLDGVFLEEPHVRKKPSLRNQSRSIQERSGDGWAGFTKLPHLSGRSKPLHRRNTHTFPEESITESELSRAISVTRPLALGSCDSLSSGPTADPRNGKSLSPTADRKRKQFSITKSASCDTSGVGDIAVRHLAVQMPNTSSSHYERMSILELSEALCEKCRDTDRNIQLLEAIQNCLELSMPSGSLRELVLRSLYAHIDAEDERVLVAIARAMFTIRVTGPHLAAACKLVFKLARNDKNDHFFRESNLLELLIEGCGRADPLTEDSCIVYGAGALRFLALEPNLCILAHQAGALHLTALHLKLLNTAKADNPRSLSEQTTHALYQLTGALRNLAGASENEQRAFVASGALAELVNALVHHTDRDVLTNVARCLSVLSAEPHCCEYLCTNPSSTRAILLSLAACAARAPLAVRLAYTLGNMAAADETAGLQIYNEDGGVDVLLTILESYTKRTDDGRDTDIDPDLHLVGTDLGGSDGSNEDVLIKTVRVIANLCLAERAGRGLATVYVERTVKALLACLALAEKRIAMRQSDVEAVSERSGELATAVLATLNNITFYKDPPDPPDPTDDTLDLICKATCRWLNSPHEAASCEAVRALGNVSRCARAASLIVLEDALNMLGPFLQHDEPTVRCAAAGVLVNVCGSGVDAAGAAALAAQALGVAAAAGDAEEAALLARALWNSHAHRPLAAVDRDRAANALAEFIDDESVFAACEASKIHIIRRASDPQISKHHVKFPDNNNHEPSTNYTEYQHSRNKPFKAYSVDHQLQDVSDEDRVSGEDLGFEEGDLGGDECECGPCRRLYAWEELVGVAIPLLEKLRPTRSDASVGTD